MDITSKTEAARLGLKTYFTGRRCVRGHMSTRYVSGGVCTQCHIENSRKNKIGATPQKLAALDPSVVLPLARELRALCDRMEFQATAGHAVDRGLLALFRNLLCDMESGTKAKRDQAKALATSAQEVPPIWAPVVREDRPCPDLPLPCGAGSPSAHLVGSPFFPADLNASPLHPVTMPPINGHEDQSQDSVAKALAELGA